MSQKGIQPKTGIARPATMVLMAPARAVSSHMRKQYEERYRSKYRFAAWVFAFDVFLAGLAACLALINLFLWSHISGSRIHLEASIYAPPLVSSKIIPVEAVIAATDGRVHRDLRLTWDLPAAVEVVDASPRQDVFGSVHLGDVLPLQEVRAQIRVRVRAQVGEKIPIGIHLAEGMWSQGIQGKDIRLVESGLVQTGLALPVTGVLPHAAIPIRVRNNGEEQVGPMVLRIVGAQGAETELGQDQAFDIPALPPRAERIIALRVGEDLGSTVRITWQIEQGGRVVERKTVEWKKSTEEWAVGVEPKADGAVEVTTPAQAVLYSAYGEQSIEPGKHSIPWPAEAKDGTVYLAFPGADGQLIAAPALSFPFKPQVPFISEARYYAASGDQIGVGPHPPQAGEETTYWVFWRIGPVPAAIDAKQAQAILRLAPGVGLTGAFTSPNGGQVTMGDGEVRWVLPSMDVGATAEYGAEVRLKPTDQDIGRVLPLTATSTLQFGRVAQQLGPVDTRLREDQHASSTGEVIPMQ